MSTFPMTRSWDGKAFNIIVLCEGHPPVIAGFCSLWFSYMELNVSFVVSLYRLLNGQIASDLRCYGIHVMLLLCFSAWWWCEETIRKTSVNLVLLKSNCIATFLLWCELILVVTHFCAASCCTNTTKSVFNCSLRSHQSKRVAMQLDFNQTKLDLAATVWILTS